MFKIKVTATLYLGDISSPNFDFECTRFTNYAKETRYVSVLSENGHIYVGVEPILFVSIVEAEKVVQKFLKLYGTGMTCEVVPHDD